MREEAGKELCPTKPKKYSCQKSKDDKDRKNSRKGKWYVRYFRMFNLWVSFDCLRLSNRSYMIILLNNKIRFIHTRFLMHKPSLELGMNKYLDW